MNYSSGDIALWSKLGPRAVYGLALQKLIEKNPSVIALSADLGNSSGLDRLRKLQPDRFINVGIAEQTLIGMSAGLANEGFIPFASTFAPFATMRAAEQIRMNLGYMEMNVKVVGIGSGLSMAFLGNSHYGLEDLSIIRAIPGITILSPSDALEVVKCVEAAAQHVGPTYIRLTGIPNNPIVNDCDYEYSIGKAITLQEGLDIAIIATGSMVYHALQASAALAKSGVSCEVLNMHTIKPLDLESLDSVFTRFSKVVTLEEHSTIGGLGSAIAEILACSRNSVRLLSLGLPDKFGPTGNYSYLLDYYGLSASGISATILNFHQAL